MNDASIFKSLYSSIFKAKLPPSESPLIQIILGILFPTLFEPIVGVFRPRVVRTDDQYRPIRVRNGTLQG